MSPLSSTDVFDVWCPADSIWSAWAKPLLFVVETPKGPDGWPATLAVEPTPLPWLTQSAFDSFVIVDLPAEQGIATGLALAEKGFRPVPLYNGAPGLSELIDVTPVQMALAGAAPRLAALRLPADAPPAFLLDARRMLGTPMPRDFDNRWVVIPEDFPSANRLLAHGLRRCILVAPPAHTDLDHVLARYRQGGISLERVVGEARIPFDVSPPSRFISLFRRLAVQMGLRRSSAGGFGAIVPVPAETSGGG